MYAVIRAGGKQHKVAKGDVIEVELLKDGKKTVDFVPLMVVDDKGKTTAGASALKGAKVTAKVLGETQGEKIHVYKYKNKTGYRRHNGHRQRYTSIEISDIKLSASKAKVPAKSEEEK
ncbi:MAG: 50S ribosomal protein L21 [Actinobacteria bacterium]|nr:50S ribosomal protein L21 [Actinomycetota bacterium]